MPPSPTSRCPAPKVGPTRPRRRLVALGIALLAAGGGLADAAETPRSPDPGATVRSAATLPALGDDELILEEVFQSHLPTTLAKHGFRLSVNPHLGDWQHKDRLRLTTRLRYGLTEHCELSAGSNLFFSHGHGAVRAFEDGGAANLRLGAKFNLGPLLFSGWDTAAGAEYEFPVGRPAAELTDGLRHLRPYVTFSHRLAAHPNLRIFVDFHGDITSRTSVPGKFGENALRGNSSGFTGGWVIDRGNLHYTFEASFNSTRRLGRTGGAIYTIRPGVLWEIPTRRDHQIRSNWVVGFAFNDTFGPGGNNLGVAVKLRYNRDLKHRSHHSPVEPVP